MTDYFNIEGGFIQSYPVPSNLAGWRVATPDDYESLRVSDWPAAIAERRWIVETAGIAWRGFGIATDDRSQLKLQAERAAARDGLRTDGAGWKCLDLATGVACFRPTTNAEVIEMADAVYGYVSACFIREAELLAMGDAVTLDDLAIGWPEI